LLIEEKYSRIFFDVKTMENRGEKVMHYHCLIVDDETELAKMIAE